MTDTAVPSRRLLDGRYELGAVIGQGTFGRVFRGYDRRLDRPVAVKMIRPWWTEDPQWAEHFEREARLMAKVNAPGIVHIYDVGRTEEGAYYVAELVDGVSLAERLRSGPLAPAEALEVAEQLCRALGEAHAQRVVHRDVKPGNVLLTRDGRVKVGDFGVARLAEGTSDDLAGSVLGTPQYMAPEQARGRKLTPSTDVYGAGVILYEMLAGRPPFQERSAVELALRHISDPPPPLPVGVPDALVKIVDRALAKDPADRYPSAGEMAKALHAARAEVGDGAAAARTTPDARVTPAARTTPVARVTPAARTTPVAPRRIPATRVAPRRNRRRDVNLAESRRYRLLLACVLLVLLGVVMAVVLTTGGSVRVPSVRGLDRAAATARLKHLGLRAGFRRRYDRVAAGTVIAQEPSARTSVSDGSTVHLVLSAGPPPVPVPQVVGQRSVDATVILARLGLSATTVQVAAPGVTPGLVVQQSATTKVPAHSRITLSVAEVPRWRPLTSFSGSSGGSSVPFRIRGGRWRLVYSMTYDGTCELIFFCSGPSARVTNVTTGGTVSQFDLNDGSGQTRVFSSGPGVYRISLIPGSDNARWSIQVEDDY